MQFFILLKLQIYLFPFGQIQSVLCCSSIFIPMCCNAWQWGSKTTMLMFHTVQIIMSLHESALSTSIHLLKYIPKPTGCTKEIQLSPQWKCCSTSPTRNIYHCEQFKAFKWHQHARKWKITCQCIPQTQVHFPAAKTNYSHTHDREHLKQITSCKCLIKAISIECSIQHATSP